MATLKYWPLWSCCLGALAHSFCGQHHTEGCWYLTLRGVGTSDWGVLVPHTEGCWCLTLRGVGTSHRGVLVPHTEGCWCLTQRGVDASHRGVLVPHTEGCWCLIQRGVGTSHWGVLEPHAMGSSWDTGCQHAASPASPYSWNSDWKTDKNSREHSKTISCI